MIFIVRVDLGDQINSVKDQMKEIEGDIKEMKHGLKGLTARQTEMELHDMSVAEKLLKDCGKNK